MNFASKIPPNRNSSFMTLSKRFQTGGFTLGVLGNPRFWGALFLILGTVLAWRTGITRDELEETSMAISTWRYLLAGFPKDYMPFYEVYNQPYYGEILNLIVLPFQFLLTGSSLIGNEWTSNPQVYAIKHVAIFWLSAFSVYSLFKSFSLTGFSKKESLLFSALLPSCLYFFGHSLMNNKDIPFAAAMTFSSYLIGKSFLSSAERTLRSSILIGLSVGLAACCRIGGLVQLFHLALILLWFSNGQRSVEKFGAATRFWTVAAVTALLVTWLGYPATWRSPFLFGDIFKYMNEVPVYDSPIHLWGQVLPAAQPVWYYIPSWFLVKVPLLLIASLLGYGALKWHVRKFNSFELIFCLQLFTLPLLAILFHSVLFNGLRHFLFIFPALVFLAGIFLKESWIRHPKLIVSILFLHFALSLADLTLLGTHAYTYFNEIARTVGAEDRMEKDYWGESGKESAKKILELGVKPGDFVIVSYESLYKPFLPAGVKVQDLQNESPPAEAIQKGFYFATHLKYGSPGEYTNCPEVDRIQVHTLGGKPYTLGVIRKCPPEN